MLRRLRCFFPTITTPFDSKLMAELSSSFPDVKVEVILGLVDKFNGHKDLITEHILSQNELLLNPGMRHLLKEKTLTALELMSDDDDDHEEFDEQPGSLSDIPLEWYNLSMVPSRFHPLINIAANQPELLRRLEERVRKDWSWRRG